MNEIKEAMKLNEIAQNVDSIVHANFPPYESGTLDDLDRVISDLIKLKVKLKDQHSREYQRELSL